jgi:hypothetical protein
MNPIEQFVLDFFQLGPRQWMEKYRYTMPSNMDGQTFTNEIIRMGLEKKFIDKPWPGGYVEPLPCYLEQSEKDPQTYSIVLIENNGFAIIEKANLSLHEGILAKSEILISKLTFPAFIEKRMKEHKQFVLDYLKLGPVAWVEKYKSNIPEAMTDYWFVGKFRSLELESDFINEHEWRLDHSVILCYLSPTKDGHYDVINVKERGLTVTAGKNLSLEDALILKSKLLFERLENK